MQYFFLFFRTVAMSKFVWFIKTDFALYLFTIIVYSHCVVVCREKGKNIYQLSVARL